MTQEVGAYIIEHRRNETHCSGGVLRWSVNPPTEPGWYWIFEKINGKRSLSVHWFSYTPEDSVITHWLGPLPVPDPPKV